MNKRVLVVLSSAIALTCTPVRADTFTDEFVAGVRSAFWTVTQSTSGQYGMDDSHGDVRLARVSPSSPGGVQYIDIVLNLNRFGGPVSGDFAAQVEFRNANVALGGLNQVELHSAFADGRYLYVVFDNDFGSNLNFHAWDGGYHNQIRTSATSGTMRITRVGSTVTAFMGNTPIYSIQDSQPLMHMSFMLQNNAGGAAPISVTYDNFSMTADMLCITPGVTGQPSPAEVCPGASSSFSVIADGTEPLDYQWQWQPAPGGAWIDVTEGLNTDPQGGGDEPLQFFAENAQTGLLTVTPVGATAIAGTRWEHRCVLENACGSTTSDPATLTIGGSTCCVGDFNKDGGIDGADVESFFTEWESGNAGADVNADGGIDGADVEYFFERWEAGC